MQVQEEQRLSLQSERLVAEFESAGGNWVQVPRMRLDRILNPQLRPGPQSKGRQGPGPRRGKPPGDRRRDGPPKNGPHKSGPHQNDSRRPPPPPIGAPPPPVLSAEDFAANVGASRAPTALYDQHGQWIAGAPDLGDRPSVVVMPLTLGNTKIGELKTLSRQRYLPREETQFLAQQRRTKWFIGIVSLLIAAAIAYVLANSIQRPIRQILTKLRDLSDGDYSVRLDSTSSDEIGRLMQDVNHLAVTLSEGQSARKRWLADVSHELRTPLAALTAEIEALKDGVREYNGERLESLDAQTSRLRRLVDDLYQLSLSDMGGLRYTYEPFDLVQLVRGAVEQTQVRAEGEGLALTFSGAQSLRVNADSLRIEQLTNNLLNNSISYTDAPGTVRVSLNQEQQRAVLEISDSAPSVDAAECSRLFDPLYRREAARDRRRGGAGLGLAICKNIVAAHQGRIRAYPSELGGLTVRVELPLYGESV